MTTVKETKCHPFFDKFIFPDGAQFPLDTAISVSEKNKLLRLKHIESLDHDYYLTIKTWNEKLARNKFECIKCLDNSMEKYRSFTLYLKWAEYVYKTGKSRCYTCVWEKI